MLFPNLFFICVPYGDVETQPLSYRTLCVKMNAQSVGNRQVLIQTLLGVSVSACDYVPVRDEIPSLVPIDRESGC
uniref:Uncharacterized protein n=1 Tax=Ralstonia solanacearum TaxID=305 RepID=A0A0S4WR27_RALSL|nr:protein of unknown function [Ralstonia solanacearum]